MMARTQVTLDPENHRRARRRAAALGISLAEYFRRLVAEDIGSAKRKVDVANIFDLGESRGSDIAAEKDAYVAAAVEADLRRRPRKRRNHQ
jgi:hypothetical protein